MNKRMVDGGIWANEKFCALPAMARLLQLGMINLADDQGRLKAHPAYLRSQIFPYEDLKLTDIEDWTFLIASHGTIMVYEVDGKEYIQLQNWWEYQSLQFAAPSEYPRPEGWHDRVRYNAKGHFTLTCNWTTVSGERLEDLCDEEGKPLPIVATLPPKNPGGRPPKNLPGNPPENLPSFPPGNPPGNINKDQIKEREGESAGARVTAPKTPPPQKTRQELTNERAKRNSAGDFAGCDPTLLTVLTNHVKHIYGYDLLIDSPGDDKLEDKMRREAYRLWQTGFQDDDAMGMLETNWKQFSAGFKIKRPQGDQLYELAVDLSSRVGDVTTRTPVNGFHKTKREVQRMEGEDW